jgi:beta-galactosidase
VTPTIPVTTNFMGTFFPLNYHEWGPALDVAAWDNYPLPESPFTEVAFSHALTRGLKGGEPFLLMEQTPSQQNWSPHCRLKPPGQLRLQSYQAIAHGAESVMYFQWRRSRGGIEKLHGAVIEHPGREDARVLREVATLGAELASLEGRTLGGRTPARVAVVFDWECWWALSASSGPSRDLDYRKEVLHAYAVLHASGIQADVVGPQADLSRYDVIVLSTAYMMRAAQAQHIVDRVVAGAALVVTCFSALVDECDRIHEGGAPGPLREVLGLTVEEFDALPPGTPQGVRFDAAFGEVAAGEAIAASLLCDRVFLHGAQPLARYTHEFYAGDAAVTVHAHGSGEAYYIGTRLEEGGLGRLLRAICHMRAIASPLRDGATPPSGLEVTERVTPGGKALLYLLNHGGAPCEAPLRPGVHVDLLTGKRFESAAALEPRSVLILERTH